MPRTSDDVENYLLELDRRFENDGGTYVVTSTEDRPPIAILVSAPIVAIRVDIGPEPKDVDHQAKLFRRLLQFNADDLMHASYGIENSTIVLSAALPLDNLDKNELEAVLSDIDLALSRHVPVLHEIANA